jgi:aminoglycoside 6'-N-acetyltransferase
MLADWLARPHIREWWGAPEAELGYIRDMVEGRDRTCEPFIVSLDGEPAGYIQFWRVAPHQTPEGAEHSPWLMQLPSDAIGVDLSIADAARLGRGIGSAALRSFCAGLRARGHRTIVIDPDPGNARAVAAYRRAGFRPMPGVTAGRDKALLMQFDPDASQT